MKKHTYKTKTKAGLKRKFKPTPPTLEIMAVMLTDFARMKLRDGVLQGRLRGAEEDVRQEAVIIAIGWLDKHLQAGKPLKSWNFMKSLSIALRFGKLRYLRQLDKSPHTIGMENPPEEACDHPAHQHLADRSVDCKRVMVASAILAAKQSGSISEENARAAELVLVVGMTVEDAAKIMRITRSAVYQQLGRTKRAIRPAMEKIEVPYEM